MVLRGIRRVRIASGAAVRMTVRAKTVTIFPTSDADRPKSAEICGMSPLGRNSVAIEMNIAPESVSRPTTGSRSPELAGKCRPVTPGFTEEVILFPHKIDVSCREECGSVAD
ncbi:hypothetical protein NtRootA1_21960 [Arthrobacter sp. NtRootA1]|nr:hypothetical protein NtRootA1_21960 [Arthrobacter sp. NtRootA1]